MKSLKWNSIKIFTTFLLLLFFTGFLQAQERELAKGKYTTQSSNYTSASGQSGKAVDGNVSGIWDENSVTHTNGNGESYPWWEVDLGEISDISRIEIWNRTDCCMDRLSNMRILIKKNMNDTGDLFMGNDHQYSSNENYPLTFNGSRQGRYVRIQLINPNAILSLAEVKVYGLPVGELIGTPLYFDGIKSVDIPANPYVNLQGEGTVEFNIAATWANEPGYNPCILAVRDTQQTLYSFHISSDRQAIAFWNGKDATFVAYDFSDGGGYHVAMVTKGNSTTVYVDGESIATMDMGYNNVTGLPLHIGTSDGKSEGFIGGITGVRIFNRALPQNTIREYMRTVIGIGPTHPYFNNLMGYSKYNASRGDFQFLLTNNSITPAPPAPPQILSPSINSTVPNNCNNTKMKWDFDWTDVPNATQYQIYVARQGSSNPVVNNVTTTRSNYTYERAGSTVVDGLLDNWYVKVRANVNGTWTNWTADKPFKVAACPKPTTIKFSNNSIYAVSYEVTVKHSDPNLLPSVQAVNIGIAGASKSITVPGDATVSVKGSALKITTWTSVFNLGYKDYGSGKTWCFDIVTGFGTLGYTSNSCQ